MTSWTTRMPFFQTVCASLLPGSGPRSRRKITAGRPSAAIAPISELRISGRRPMPDSATPASNAARASSRSSSEDTEGWRISIDLVVAHQLAGPLDGADADEQQGEAEEAADRHVGGAEPADGVGVVTDREHEVGDAAEHREHGREAEQHRDLALGPPLGGRVDVGRARKVRLDPGVGDRVRLGARDLLAVHVAHASSPVFLTRAVWAAIQTAKPTSTPMPTSHANRPSDTGPSAPMEKPP